MLLQLVNLLRLRVVQQTGPLHIEVDLLLSPELSHACFKLVCPVHVVVILFYPLLKLHTLKVVVSGVPPVAVLGSVPGDVLLLCALFPEEVSAVSF